MTRASLRTPFLEFENDDGEQDSATFTILTSRFLRNLSSTGKEDAKVGVHFRAARRTRWFQPDTKGRLISRSISSKKDQYLYGFRTRNLLNSHDDDSLMSTVLYYTSPRQSLAGPKANFVRVVING